MVTRILVVDDDPGILKSTELLLLELGYEVHTTTEHRDVPGLLLERRPHVLLQDVRMPGLDLDALLGEIRADPVVGGTPVLLFSASLDLEDVVERLDVAGMLEKPFRPADLIQAIARALEGAGPERPVRGETA